MYGHPSNPDPWSSVVDEPALYTEPVSDPDSDPSGFLAALLVMALPVFAFAFALGYVSGAQGWF